MRQWVQSTVGISKSAIAAAALAGSLLTLVAFAPHAAASESWSRSPPSALGGTPVRVASSADTLCQWRAPAPASGPAPTVPSSATSNATSNAALSATAVGDPIVYDGTRVELRIDRDGVSIPLGAVDVTPGGAWSGTVTAPAATVAPAGNYLLMAHCVVDNPALDGVRSFDFDPLPFTVADAPPPTTVTLPTEIGDAVSVTNPVQVQGAQLDRRATSHHTSATGPTLPKTGDGTLTVALAGLGALVIGAAALWWGSRKLTPAKP